VPPGGWDRDGTDGMTGDAINGIPRVLAARGHPELSRPRPLEPGKCGAVVGWACATATAGRCGRTGAAPYKGGGALTAKRRSASVRGKEHLRRPRCESFQQVRLGLGTRVRHEGGHKVVAGGYAPVLTELFGYGEFRWFASSARLALLDSRTQTGNVRCGERAAGAGGVAAGGGHRGSVPAAENRLCGVRRNVYRIFKEARGAASHPDFQNRQRGIRVKFK